MGVEQIGIQDPDLFYTTMSTMMLTDPKPKYVFDQFVSKQVEFLPKGKTIDLKRLKYFGDVGLSQISRKLSRGSIIGTGNALGVTTENVKVELAEFAGPYNDAESKVVPLGLEEFDVRRANLALSPIADKPGQNMDVPGFWEAVSGKLLKDDHDRVHDRILCDLYLTSPYTLNPGSKADGSTLVTDKFDVDDLMSVVEILHGDRKIDTFDDGYYYSVVSPRIEKHLRQDDKWRDFIQWNDPNNIKRGILGTYEKVKFFSSNNIPTETVNSLTAHLGMVFGPQAVGYGEGLPVQVRQSRDTDYDRYCFLIWLTYRGYAALDTRFIQVIRSFAS